MGITKNNNGMLNSVNTINFGLRGLHSFSKCVIIGDIYLNGLGLSNKLTNKLSKTKEITRRRNPHDQHKDLGPEQLYINEFAKFFAANARTESKFHFFGFANKISFIIFLLAFIMTFGTLLLSIRRLMINFQKNYGGKSENYVKRIDNKAKIRGEFKKRIMRVANKKFGKPKIYHYAMDDPTYKHDQYANALDHHTFSRFNLNHPVYDSTDYIKDANQEEIQVRRELQDFANEQVSKRKNEEHLVNNQNKEQVSKSNNDQEHHHENEENELVNEDKEPNFSDEDDSENSDAEFY